MKLSPTMQNKVMFIDDERNDGSSIIVTLRYGYRFTSDPLSSVHVEGFDTVRDAKTGIKNAVACYCSECTNPNL